MVKRVSLLKKRPDLTFEEFARYWCEHHAALARRLPGLKRYVINLVKREEYPDAPVDGFSELWFDDWQALETAVKSDLRRLVKADEPNFTAEVHTFDVEERPIK